jgi:hypothetical protein
MQSNLETIMSTMSSLVSKIREDHKNLSFVQIGSHDCTTYEDLPSSFLKSEDYGHYIEPVEDTFSKLKSNRFEYVNSKFYNLCILPTDEFYSEFFHVDTKGCQSTYIKGIYYDNKTENEDWVLSKPQSLSIKKFVDNNNIQTPNIYFVSTQGYDNDIIKEILNIHSPNIFFAESWDMSQINNVIETNRTETPKSIKFTTREELIGILQSKGYKCLYETS